MSSEKFIWLDLEMTGLDPNNCHILQAAMVITTLDLNDIISKEIVMWQPEEILNKMSPTVQKMHTDNGLLNQVRASKTSVAEAQQQFMQIITKYVPYQKGLLAGNSVWCDRMFLKKYMPSIDSYLNYRIIDISSLKILCKNWGKKTFNKPKSQHTALEDIRASIQELKFYKEEIFRK